MEIRKTAKGETSDDVELLIVVFNLYIGYIYVYHLRVPNQILICHRKITTDLNKLAAP